MSFTTTIYVERELPWLYRLFHRDVDYQELEVEVVGSYSAGLPMSMGNPLRGDMGHPEEPPEIEAEDASCEDDLIIPFLWIFWRRRRLEFCDLTGEEVEAAEMQVFEDPPEDDFPEPEYYPHEYDNRNQHDTSL